MTADQNHSAWKLDYWFQVIVRSVSVGVLPAIVLFILAEGLFNAQYCIVIRQLICRCCAILIPLGEFLRMLQTSVGFSFSVCSISLKLADSMHPTYTSPRSTATKPNAACSIDCVTPAPPTKSNYLKPTPPKWCMHRQINRHCNWHSFQPPQSTVKHPSSIL